MSTLKTNNLQLGQSITATQNFVFAVPTAPDGTVKLSRGNVGATTQDILLVDTLGNITMPGALTINSSLVVNSSGRFTGPVTIANAALASHAVALGQFAFAAAANGYATLPSGLIIQWGAYSGTTNPVPFNTPFPNACLQVIPSFGYNSGAAFAGGYQFITSITTTGFSLVYAAGSAPGVLRWIALGY